MEHLINFIKVFYVFAIRARDIKDTRLEPPKLRRQKDLKGYKYELEFIKAIDEEFQKGITTITFSQVDESEAKG